MRKTDKTIILLSGLLLGFGVHEASAQQGNIGIVDKVKLYSAYPALKTAANEIKQDEERLHKLIERSNKQFEEAKKAKKPQQELTDLHKHLQTEIDGEFQKFQKKALNMEKTLEGQLDDAIRNEAKGRQLDAVFDKSAVLLGGQDITDGVVKRLAASGVPPATGASK